MSNILDLRAKIQERSIARKVENDAQASKEAIKQDVFIVLSCGPLDSWTLQAVLEQEYEDRILDISRVITDIVEALSEMVEQNLVQQTDGFWRLSEKALRVVDTLFDQVSDSSIDVVSELPIEGITAVSIGVRLAENGKVANHIIEVDPNTFTLIQSQYCCGPPDMKHLEGKPLLRISGVVLSLRMEAHD